MSNETVNTFIKMVIEENLVQAQATLKEYLNDKLTEVLQEKYEEYAPTIFEAKKADKDYDGDGEIETSEEEHRGVVDNAIKARMAQDKKQSDSEEEDDEDEEAGDDEDGEDSEDGEEDEEENGGDEDEE